MASDYLPNIRTNKRTMTLQEFQNALELDYWRFSGRVPTHYLCDSVGYKRFHHAPRCVHNDDKEGIGIEVQLFDRSKYGNPGIAQCGAELCLYGATSDNDAFQLMHYTSETIEDINRGCEFLLKAWEAIQPKTSEPTNDDN